MGSVLRRLLFFFQRNQFDRDLEDELRFHEEMKAHALADADGMSGDEARAAARRRMGNPLRLREQSREPWSFVTVETFAQDVRHALRLMRRDPAFTFTALATLALGIGLNTAIFSVAYGVLWRPLPYPNPDRLVIVSSAQQTETGVKTFSTWAPVSYEALRPRVTALDHLAAYSSIDAQLTGRGEPLQLPALDVSPNFFATLGVTPARGRAFLTGAAAPDDDRSAIVSDRLWRTSLEADPAIVGQSITIDGLPRTVVGVLPPDFSFRPVIPRLGALPEADIFLPNRWPGDTGRNAFLFLLGRMKPGVTQERAEAELTALVNDPSIVPAGALATEGTLAPNVRTLARVVGLQEYGTESVRTLLLILLGAVSFVLLIACVNVANLQMARLTARRGELSVRMALGAGRRRIVRQLLTEAVVLSLLGAALGVMLAQIAIDVTLPLVPQVRAATPRRHRDRRARDGVLPRLVARLDSADRPRAGAARQRGRVWRRPRAARRRSAHDGRPPGRAAADAAGRRADRDDARPPDRRGPADSQLRASHVGVARLRIERARRRRADRQGDAARTALRRARAHPCVRARRARSHPVPAGREVRERDQLGAVRHDVHPRRVRHRGAAEADARCRQAEDRRGLFQDHGDSAAGGTRVHRAGYGGSAESGDRQRAHRARLLSGWPGRGARPARALGRSRRVADGGGRGRGHPSDGTRSGSAAHALRAVPAGARSVRPAVRVVRRAHGHTRQRGRRHPRGNSPRRARSADREHA